MSCRKRNRGFGVRDSFKVLRRIWSGLFGVRGRVQSIMSYMESAVWCTAIQIMMRTAKKRALILVVGGGFDVAV